MKKTTYDDARALVEGFSKRIADLLKGAIATHGRGSLLVSGGRTPIALFQALANIELAWDKVDVSLVDERWVEPGDDASNEKLVRENLLQNHAAGANFIGLKTAHQDAEDATTEVTARMADVARPFTVLILGMGEDGHTASLFPCSEQLPGGLAMDSGNIYMAAQPTTAPHQRMTLTLPALLNSENLFLHLTGERKLEVLEQAATLNDESKMPIQAVLNRADVELVWAP